jgi:hypothetical protein
VAPPAPLMKAEDGQMMPIPRVQLPHSSDRSTPHRHSSDHSSMTDSEQQGVNSHYKSPRRDGASVASRSTSRSAARFSGPKAGSSKRGSRTPTKCADEEAAEVLSRARAAAERANAELSRAEGARLARTQAAAKAEAAADAEFRKRFARSQSRAAAEAKAKAEMIPESAPTSPAPPPRPSESPASAEATAACPGTLPTSSTSTTACSC